VNDLREIARFWHGICSSIVCSAIIMVVIWGLARALK